MCGIAGVLGAETANLSRDSLADPLRTLRHRGPDDDGWTGLAGAATVTGRRQVDADVGAILLHRRLSILDLSPLGAQPMATADGRHHLAFNGEIYNYIELREELTREGCVFRSRTDTEVLLHALVRWGPPALSKLVGMFAFALLDADRRTLFLARDFFGIKPLYYVRTGDLFAFASEIKSLLHLPGVRPAVDPQRLYEYLRFGRTDHGDGTLFAQIRQLPAGHHLTVSLDANHSGQPVRYWDLGSLDPIDITFEDAARRVRELFLDNIRCHLRSDVPVGAALSGGIDSSAILSAMRAVEPTADLHAFSYIAADPALSEERWVDLVGSAMRAKVHKIHATPAELRDDLDDLIYSQDEPFGSTSIYAQYRVFRKARESGVPVMLDGQGADELFAGYGLYRAGRLATLVRRGHWIEALRFARRQPGAMRLLLGAMKALAPLSVRNAVYRHLSWSNAIGLERRWFRARGVDGPMPTTTGCDRPDFLREQLRETLLTTSVPMLLRFEDRNSMAASVESRVPFLTPGFAQFVLRLPEQYLLAADGTTKSVFRAAMRGIVPDPILDRRDKIGFATPEREWLVTLRPWVEATLASPRAESIGALDAAAMRREWQAVVQGRRPFDFRIWRWLNVIRWAERFDVIFD